MKVSVIVPIYNVEAYLSACLESIIGQTLKDIEIILVNDGSTDNSLSIAEEFARQDERVRLVSQINSGQAKARNVGLNLAQGDYVVFVDSDDWIEPNMLEVLYQNVMETGSDFVQCRFQFDNPYTGRQVVYGHKYEHAVLYKNDILADALLVKNIQVAPWGKMYSRNFLQNNHLRFEEGIVNEDTLFSIEISCCAQKVSFVNDVLCHTIERKGSTSRASYERLCKHMVIALNKAKEYMQGKGVFEEFEAIYKARYLKSILYNLLQMAQRLPYKEYRRIWQWNMENSQYKEYNQRKFRMLLPLVHRAMINMSCFPLVCFVVVRLGNLLSIRMH